jgi:hypothetical protein
LTRKLSVSCAFFFVRRFNYQQRLLADVIPVVKDMSELRRFCVSC